MQHGTFSPVNEFVVGLTKLPKSLIVVTYCRPSRIAVSGNRVTAVVQGRACRAGNEYQCADGKDCAKHGDSEHLYPPRPVRPEPNGSSNRNNQVKRDFGCACCHHGTPVRPRSLLWAHHARVGARLTVHEPSGRSMCISKRHAIGRRLKKDFIYQRRNGIDRTRSWTAARECQRIRQQARGRRVARLGLSRELRVLTC